MTIDWTRAVVLSAVEFDVAWELLDLGRTPAALELPSPGTTWPERDRIVADALRTLHDRALVHGSAPIRGLAADLRTLSRPDTVRDLVVTAPTRYAAIAATTGPTCVLAVRLDDRVALVRIPPERAAAELVELLGPVAPGPGPTIRVPARAVTDAVAASSGDRDRFTAELLRHGLDGPEVSAVLRMGELTGAGQLGADRRAEVGRRRAPYPLLLHVTAHGFYRQRRVPRGGEEGETLMEAGPVNAATLVRELDELVALTRR